MATNIVMNILNANGTYTELYPRTSAEQVSSGVLNINRIPNLSTDKITSGVLDPYYGGTGVNNYDSLRKKIIGYKNYSAVPSNFKLTNSTGTKTITFDESSIDYKLFLLSDYSNYDTTLTMCNVYFFSRSGITITKNEINAITMDVNLDVSINVSLSIDNIYSSTSTLTATVPHSFIAIMNTGQLLFTSTETKIFQIKASGVGHYFDIGTWEE